jgi:hypothetical protein
VARKSRELRISQAQSLMSEYETAGLTNDRSYRFMNDMSTRLTRGKGISKGQRKYLDDLIDQGVPKPKNEARVNEILTAANVDGMQGAATTLKDFAYKLGKGWNLSEKQEKFLANLLAKAETLKVEGRFRPSDEMVEDLENANAVCATKNSWYWQHRPGTAKAYNKVSQWLDWNRLNKVSEALRAEGIDEEVDLINHFYAEEPLIDQWACNKLLGAIKNQIAELKGPKFPVGSMAWTRIYTGQPNGAPRVVLISGTPKIQSGEVTYPCLVDGTMMEISTKNLRKRRG